MARAATAVVCICFAIACGSDEDSGGSGGAAGAAGSSGSAGAAGSGGSAGTGGAPSACGVSGAGAVDGNHTLEHATGTRQYTLRVPPGHDGTTPLPLVIDFHGYTSNKEQQALFSALGATADAEGFVLVHPDGLTNPGTSDQSWNAGLCCAFGDETRDDIGFVDALLDDVASKVCIDEKRVYATGMSNGGFMSHLLACERADRFAAIAPVAGVLGVPPESCQPSRPVPVIHFHGTQDSLVPYDGGGPGNFPSVPETSAGWAARNGCTGQPAETFANGTATCMTTAGCEGGVEVTLCTLEGMGHCWPGQAFCPFGNGTTDISANDAMWQFFARFALP